MQQPFKTAKKIMFQGFYPLPFAFYLISLRLVVLAGY